MARVLEALFLLGLLGGGGWLTWAGLRTARKGFTGLANRNAEWEIRFVEDDDRTAIWLVKGKGQSIIPDAPKGCKYVHLIGAVDRDHIDYSERMIDLEVQAETKRDEWNSIQKALKA